MSRAASTRISEGGTRPTANRFSAGTTSSPRSGIRVSAHDHTDAKPSSSPGHPPTSSRTRLEFNKALAELQELRLRAAEAPGTRPTSSRTRMELEEALHSKARLEAREQRAVSERRSAINTFVLRAMQLDLAFLVDVTGSMQPSINMVLDKVRWIASEILKSFPSLDMRVAFVGYRDYGDTKQVEVADFAPLSAGTFEGTLAGMHATGGGDEPEDVFSGLEAVARLSWSGGSRLLVHIADAPMHGSAYNDTGSDSCPGGDKLSRSGPAILQRLREDCGIDVYYFAHLNGSTQKMIARFKEECGDPGWIQAESIGDISRLPQKIVLVSTTTVSTCLTRMAATGGHKGSDGPFVPMTVCTTEPDWSRVEEVRVTCYRTKPLGYNELIRSIDRKEPLAIEPRGAVDRLKIAPQPFSSVGAARWPFYAVPVPGVGAKCVVKRFKTPYGEPPSKVHRRGRYEEQMEVQAVSAALAEEFNRKVAAARADAKEVSFIPVTVLAIQGRPKETAYSTMEPYLEGSFIKYSNNAGYVNTEDYRATLQAFTHWTHHATGGRLMVTDLQGVLSRPDNRFKLSDPAVHCTDLLRFSHTNLGDKGMELFFRTHQCNGICCALGLGRHPAQPSAGATSMAATGTTLRK